MPQILEIQFADSKEFESYVCDYFSIKYSTNFTTYGSAGQNQYGIDGLHYSPTTDEKTHVLQCKNWNTRDLKVSDILADVEKVKHLNINFDIFHFVTSSKKTTKLQNDIVNNIAKLTNGFQFKFEIHFYSDFFNESLTYKSIANKYFKVFLDTDDTPKQRDTNSLIMLAKEIESSFINIPYYISQVTTTETPAYTSLVSFKFLKESLPGGVFYDPKLNKYVEIFIEYLDRIQEYRVGNFTFELLQGTESTFKMKYTGKYENYYNIRMKIEGLSENFAETFKRFVSYIKQNYYDFDIHKKYFVSRF